MIPARDPRWKVAAESNVQQLVREALEDRRQELRQVQRSLAEARDDLEEAEAAVKKYEFQEHDLAKWVQNVESAGEDGDIRSLVNLGVVPHTWLRHAKSPRQDAVKNTHPINKPRGIEKSIVDEHGRSIEHRFEDEAPGYFRKDIRPEDVFAGTPDQMGVRNLAETGRDLSHALERQVPKDKGHDAVSNLSQYLIRTEGGGSGSPAGKK